MSDKNPLARIERDEQKRGDRLHLFVAERFVASEPVGPVLGEPEALPSLAAHINADVERREREAEARGFAAGVEAAALAIADFAETPGRGMSGTNRNYLYRARAQVLALQHEAAPAKPEATQAQPMDLGVKAALTGGERECQQCKARHDRASTHDLCMDCEDRIWDSMRDGDG